MVVWIQGDEMAEERETATHHAVEIGDGSPCCGHLNGMVACVTCRSKRRCLLAAHLLLDLGSPCGFNLETPVRQQ